MPYNVNKIRAVERIPIKRIMYPSRENEVRTDNFRRAREIIFGLDPSAISTSKVDQYEGQTILEELRKIEEGIHEEYDLKHSSSLYDEEPIQVRDLELNIWEEPNRYRRVEGVEEENYTSPVWLEKNEVFVSQVRGDSIAIAYLIARMGGVGGFMASGQMKDSSIVSKAAALA